MGVTRTSETIAESLSKSTQSPLERLKDQTATN
jgi:hypothetical protein